MAKNESLCSVLIPAYNCETTLRATVESALRQSYETIEVLIIDDASTDNTAMVMRSLAAEDCRVRLFFLEKNRGVAEARNELFTKIEGAYAAFLDSDDLWLSNKLEEQMQLLLSSNADLVYSSYEFIDGLGRTLGKPKIVPVSCCFTDLLKENFILPSTVVMRSCFLADHRMDGSYAHEDFVFWLSLLKDGVKAVGNPKILIRYRVAFGNRSANKLKASKNRWIVYRNYLQFCWLKSAWYFIQYTYHGMRKYRGITKT